MHVFLAFTGAFLLLYSFLILYYHRLWDRITPGENEPTATPDLIATRTAVPNGKRSAHLLKVSIIIPARNEELHIGDCLGSIFNQSYPAAQIEVIVVNDFSTDNTASVVEQTAGRAILLNLHQFAEENSLNAHKKKAIETGIAHASGELIVCTDADCTAGPEWIETLVQSYLKNDYKILAAPVKIETDGSLLSIFQALDFISLQGITGAAIHKNLYPMANGANLAYGRAAFYSVDGFKGIDHIASGDDMLLMAKMQARFPGKAGYLKNSKAIVSTEPADSLIAFFQQRIRWASKISHYGHPAIFITLALVYTLNVCLLLLFFLSFKYDSWHWLIAFLMFKTFAEYFFVSKVAAFFQQRALMSYFILCQPFHIIYTVAAGTFGVFGKYSWKNRRVK
ncbi:MAG: glycosyltransferase [Bacteroidota bacterium]|nr:glycosyltransferase [Bacteroidota bacterium]